MDSQLTTSAETDIATVLERLDEELTQDMYDRLVLHAQHKVNRLFWQGGIYGAPLPEGLEANDIVRRMVRRVLLGAREGPGKDRRCWDAEGDLYKYLASAIDSEVSNLVSAAANQLMRLASVHDGATNRAAEGARTSVLERDSKTLSADEEAWRPQDLPDPEELVLREEREAEHDRFFWGFYEFVKDRDEELLPYLEEILDGCIKPRELADSLGVPVDRVYNAKKRLRRQLSAHLQHEKERRSQDG